MMPWFRLYHEVLHDPKVQNLSASDFKAWVNLLCVACQNDGYFPDAKDCAFALRMKPTEFGKVLERLKSAGLVRVSGTDDSCGLPHGWAKRQAPSDSSRNRVKRHRDRYSNASEADGVTVQTREDKRRPDEDGDHTESRIARANGTALHDEYDDVDMDAPF